MNRNDITAADAQPAIDPDTVDRLHGLIDAAPADAAGAQRVKQRLLRRIASDATERHLTVHAAKTGWQPFGAGIRIKVLHECGGVMSYLLQLAPGARVPPHRHPIDEECVVLEGEVCIGSLRVGAGGFHLGRRDMLHDALRSETGAVIFLRGAVPEVSLVL